MNELDTEILSLLVKNGRLPFAEIARELGISRAQARDRVQHLLDDGVIEQFTAIINPEKLHKTVSAFLDVRVAPREIEAIARELAAQPEVASLYIMSDMRSLHVHLLTDSSEALDQFVRKHVFARDEILNVECKTLLSRIKHRRGGLRL